MGVYVYEGSSIEKYKKTILRLQGAHNSAGTELESSIRVYLHVVVSQNCDFISFRLLEERVIDV
jgi:hypothetical protein